MSLLPVPPPAVVFGSGTASVQSLISGPTRPADLIAAFPTAAYLRLVGGRVIAVLTHDAVRLPCALVLASTSDERPLTGLRGPVVTGAGQVRIGGLAIQMKRVVSATAPRGVLPDATAVGLTGKRLNDLGFNEHGPGLADRLTAQYKGPLDVPGLVRQLLGSGSGLTPSGDDVLAGFLVGCRSFGVSVHELRTAVLTHAPTETTSLSATLLAHAGCGESIPQVDSMLRALAAGSSGAGIEKSLAALVRVGHSSGIALATGVYGAANASLELRRHGSDRRPADRASDAGPWAKSIGSQGTS